MSGSGSTTTVSTASVRERPPVSGNWYLTFNEGFPGCQINPTNWATGYWWGVDGSTNSAAHEYQWYVRDEILVVDDIMRLRARVRPSHGYNYTSGMISSDDRTEFLYGYVETRARIPAGQGLASVFGLLPADRDIREEINILSVRGQEPNTVYMAQNWVDHSGAQQQAEQIYIGTDYSLDFHRYGLLWEPDRLVWYIDGIERYRLTLNVPAEAMSIIATLAVGGDWVGVPDRSTLFPAHFAMDYIRVWQRARGRSIGGRADDELLPGGPGNDTLDSGGGADSLMGHGGDDRYYIHSGLEKVIENAAEGMDVIYSDVSYRLPSQVENLVLNGHAAISGTGNALFNVITGNDGDNSLSGGAGDDTLIGNAGMDTVIYAQPRTAYVLTRRNDGAWTVAARNGTDLLIGVEFVRFSTGDVVSLREAVANLPLRRSVVMSTSFAVLPSDAKNSLITNSF